jgi:hypothetical protein
MYLGVNTGWRWVKPQSRKATFSALLGKAMEFERMVSWRKMLTTEEKKRSCDRASYYLIWLNIARINSTAVQKG